MLQILHLVNKGKKLNILKPLEIYKYSYLDKSYMLNNQTYLFYLPLFRSLTT